MNLSNSPKTPLGYEKLTVSSTAVGLASIPSRAYFALVRCESNNVRWRDDGTAPTATEGILMKADEFLEYDGSLTKIKFIRVGSDATVYVSYYGP